MDSELVLIRFIKEAPETSLISFYIGCINT